MSQIAVIDIGKTNVKLARVDLDRGEEVAVETTPNRVIAGPPWPHFDVEAQWRFILSALSRLGAGVDGIVVTTHGASGAMLGADGRLAAPVLDYEHKGPDAMRAAYDALRPGFAETGSPALPMGLNLGAQFHYMLETLPDLRDRVAHVVTLPQFWGHRLTGQVACDLSSLGCHTDLWNPVAGDWSSLPAALGLKGKMAPPMRPDAVLGHLLPEVQAATGLGALPVLCGIHDSNASLVPHLLARQGAFSVVSTGTWVIAMAVGGQSVAIDPARDTLMNVNAFGAPVPSARFMGGREYELSGGGRAKGTETAAQALCARGAMLLPSVVPESGPFQGRQGRWTAEPADDDEREVALGFYLALMTATQLSLIGAEGPSVIEGPFAANPWFLKMLASATDRAVIPAASRTGTAIGAALLFGGKGPPQGAGEAVAPDPALIPYAEAWRSLL